MVRDDSYSIVAQASGSKYNRSGSVDSGYGPSIRSSKSKHSRNESDLSKISGVDRRDSAIYNDVDHAGTRVPPVVTEARPKEEAANIDDVDDVAIRSTDVEEPHTDIGHEAQVTEHAPDRESAEVESPDQFEEVGEVAEGAGAEVPQEAIVPPVAPMPPGDIDKPMDEFLPPLARPKKKKGFSNGDSTFSISDMRQSRDGMRPRGSRVHFQDAELESGRSRTRKTSKQAKN